MRQKMSDYVKGTIGEWPCELTLMEIAGKGDPTRAAPSTAQGGTTNTQWPRQSGRGGWSRAAVGPPPSSTAAGISHYSPPESEYPAEEHVPCVTANTGEVDLNVYADIYWINLSCIGRSESTRFQLRFNCNIQACHNGSTFGFIILVRVLQPWREPKDFSQF